MRGVGLEERGAAVVELARARRRKLQLACVESAVLSVARQADSPALLKVSLFRWLGHVAPYWPSARSVHPDNTRRFTNLPHFSATGRPKIWEPLLSLTLSLSLSAVKPPMLLISAARVFRVFREQTSSSKWDFLRAFISVRWCDTRRSKRRVEYFFSNYSRRISIINVPKGQLARVSTWNGEILRDKVTFSWNSRRSI